jgi:hypothetical protein
LDWSAIEEEKDNEEEEEEEEGDTHEFQLCSHYFNESSSTYTD